MRARIATLLGLACLLVGLAALALTGYAWFGAWPAEVKEIVDYQRSVGERSSHATDPVIQNVDARRSASLAGSWEAVIDPFGRGELAGIAPRALEPGSPSDLAEFSFRNGLRLDVPGDWNSQDPRLVFYQGAIWYKRTFEHETAPGTRTFLWFGAANYDASVHLNGRLLGRHLGGFTPFNFEVTDRLRPGENLLVVRVDNRKAPDDVPTPLTDWHNYGGLTRDVLLVDVPETFVRDYEVRLDGEERLRGWVQLEGPERAGGAVLRIPELGVELAVATDADGRGEFEATARPERWSPERPRLYDVEIQAGRDRVADRIGFRTVATRGEEILLNGEPVFLRGISIHEEAPREQGRIHSREQAAEVLGWAKALGCNFVRLAHYPHARHMAKVADELGLLVWKEIPVYWTIDFGNERTLELAKAQMGGAIERDRNRASVILWGIANETPDTEARLAFLTALAEHVRALDPSRLVTAALLTAPADLASFMLTSYLPALLGFSRGEWIYPVRDPLADVLDVTALNEYFGWYYSGGLAAVTPFTSRHARRVMIDNMDRITIAQPRGKPFLISETGAGAKHGMHRPEDELAVFSEEYQALVYRRQIDMLRDQPGLAGMSPWILKDFRSPLRLYQGVQDHWNLKGLVADDGTRKQAFAVLRDFYREVAERGR